MPPDPRDIDPVLPLPPPHATVSRRPPCYYTHSTDPGQARLLCRGRQAPLCQEVQAALHQWSEDAPEVS